MKPPGRGELSLQSLLSIPALGGCIPGAVRLGDLPPGIRGRVVSVEAASPAALDRLGGLCILPGALLELRSRRPAFLVRVGESLVAFDRRLADAIWVRFEGEQRTAEKRPSAA